MADGFERLVSLAVKVPSLESRVDGSKIRGLGTLEVEAALAKIPPEGSELLRAIYLNDSGAMRKTIARLGRADYDLTLCTLRAFAAMRPCGKCGGAGTIRLASVHRLLDTGEWEDRKARRITCPLCLGDGFDHVGHTAVQLMMGVTVEEWEERYAKRFVWMYETLRSWHDEARMMLIEALK